MKTRVRRDCLILVSILLLFVAAAPTRVFAVEYVVNGRFETDTDPSAYLSDPAPGPGFDVTADKIPDAWTIYETFMGGQSESSQVTPVSVNGPSAAGAVSLVFARSGGGASGDWTAIEQPLSIDAGAWSTLTLSMDVYLEPPAHNLEAGGTWPRPTFEWPAIVEIEYDAKSPYDTTAHTYGSLVGNPWIWRYGWYLTVLDGGKGDSTSGNGQINDPGDAPLIPIFADLAITPNVWTPTSFNLHTVLPQVDTITRIRVGASGWDYGCWIDNVSIVGIPEPMMLSLLGLGGLALLRRRRK